MAGPSDDFKWFGEGFDGFPKSLPEDCVEYSLYILDNNLKDIDVRGKLRDVQNEATKLTKVLLRGFIWQRDGFDLEMTREAGHSYLRGRTNFGDSTDDEWTILYILRELSRKCPDLWIRVFDNDGEFLLIEAANALPIWLNPEVADFRVWIHGGQLLVIPLAAPGGSRRSSDTLDKLNLEDALSWIQDPEKKLLHSTKIEAEAFVRLQQYPEQMQRSLHNTNMMLPRNLVYVLHQVPTSLSAAIEAFYLRDPIALNQIRKKKSSELTFSPSHLVKASVRCTKVGYAQLKSQQFQPPDAWIHEIGKISDAQTQDRADVGMKLSCGFEMLLLDSRNKDRQIVREIKLLLEDLASGEDHLPSDEEIQNWGMEEDDDGWLDINFEDFDRELSGKHGATDNASKSGFGDKNAHANIQRTVQRFEQLLSQEAESGSLDLIDDMDHDDAESSDDESIGTDDEPDAVLRESGSEIDEDEFTAMMREMMGMPPTVMKEIMQKRAVGEAES